MLSVEQHSIKLSMTTEIDACVKKMDRQEASEDNTNLNKLILLVKVRHLSRTQDVIDVL